MAITQPPYIDGFAQVCRKSSGLATHWYIRGGISFLLWVLHNFNMKMAMLDNVLCAELSQKSHNAHNNHSLWWSCSFIPTSLGHADNGACVDVDMMMKHTMPSCLISLHSLCGMLGRGKIWPCMASHPLQSGPPAANNPGGLQWTMCLTSLICTPRPNAFVANTKIYLNYVSWYVTNSTKYRLLQCWFDSHVIRHSHRQQQSLIWRINRCGILMCSEELLAWEYVVCLWNVWDAPHVQWPVIHCFLWSYSISHTLTLPPSDSSPVAEW